MLAKSREKCSPKIGYITNIKCEDDLPIIVSTILLAFVMMLNLASAIDLTYQRLVIILGIILKVFSIWLILSLNPF